MARQTLVIRMAIANVAGVHDLGNRPNHADSFLELSDTEICPIKASILECSTRLVSQVALVAL